MDSKSVQNHSFLIKSISFLVDIWTIYFDQNKKSEDQIQDNRGF